MKKDWDAKEFMAKHTENFTQMYRTNKISLKEASKITDVSVEDMKKKRLHGLQNLKKSGHRPRNAIYYEKGIIWGIKNYECVASVVNLGILHTVLDE